MSEVGTRVDIGVCNVRGRRIESDHSDGIFSGMMTLARGETDAPRGSVSVGVSRVGIISGSEKAVRKLVVLR